MYEIERLPQSIDIGFTGEMDFRTVQIDMSEWVAKMPEGQPTLMHIRPGESEPYPVEITFEDNIVTWSVSDEDLGTREGTGLLQVWFGVQDETEVMRQLGMSAVVATIVHLSLAGEGHNSSTVQIPWLKEVMEMKNIILGYDYEAESWANGQRGGEDVGSDDPAYHNNAKYYKEQVESMALDSEAFAAGTRGGEAVDEDDPAYHNNASYYNDQAALEAATAAAAAATASAAYNVNLLAPNYTDLTFPVKKGQPCIYSGGYYEALVDIATTEEWTSAHWKNTKVGAEVNNLKSAIDGNIAKDYIVLNGQEVKPSTLVWEQGNFTSTNDDVTSTKDIRTTTWFSGGVFIYNPSRLFQFSVMQNNGSGTKNYYDAFSSPVTGVDHYFDDAVAFIPKRKIGTYRIKVTKRVGGTGSKLEFTPSDAQVYLYEQTNQELAFMIGSVASGGYSYDLSSLVTDELQIGEHSGIRFRLVDDDYQMAVYSTSNSTSFKLTQGWWQKQGECDSWDKSKKYVCRVGAKSGVTFTYADAVKAVQIEYIDKRYCYERNYTDITYTLQWSVGNVTSGGVDSDSHYIHAELPCVGNVEVKLNWPSCKFTVWKKDENDNFVNLIDDSVLNPDVWTYYFCRYTSDDKDGTVYYVVVTSINETTTFSKFSYGKRGIKVYTYEDMGVLADSPSPWYGKRVAVMGDSIVQGRFRKGNADSTNSVCSKPWAVLVAERSNTEPADFGIGGACVYGENWLSLYTNRNKISGYDIVLVCAGTNDYKASGNYTTEENFKTAYGAVLDALIANNTKVYAVTPTRREESINETNGGGLTLHDYAEFVKSVAADKNVTVIDLYAMSVGNDEFVESLADGIHPIEYGQKIIADLILQNVPVES